MIVLNTLITLATPLAGLDGLANNILGMAASVFTSAVAVIGIVMICKKGKENKDGKAGFKEVIGIILFIGLILGTILLFSKPQNLGNAFESVATKSVDVVSSTVNEL